MCGAGFAAGLADPGSRGADACGRVGRGVVGTRAGSAGPADTGDGELTPAARWAGDRWAGERYARGAG